MRRMGLVWLLLAASSGFAQSVQVVNAGVPGENSREGRARFTKDVVERHPAYVLLYFGMNDAVNEPKFLPVEEFVANMSWMVDAARAAGIVPVVATVQHVDVARVMQRHKASSYGDEGPNGKIDRYDAALMAMAREKKVAVADVARKLDEAGGPSEAISVDGVHLTAKGYGVVARTFLMALPRGVSGVVVCLGDSLTFGVPLKAGDPGSYPAQLEGMLR